MPRPIPEVAYKILEVVATGTLLTLAALLNPRSTPKIVAGVLNEWDRGRRRRLMTRLRKKKWIRVDEENDALVLTREGTNAIRRFRIETMKIVRPPQWDGRFRMALFDVPTKPRERNKARDALRFHLKRLGFVQIRESAFVHPYPCEDEISAIAQFYGVAQWVTYAEVTNFSGSDWVKKKFNM